MPKRRRVSPPVLQHTRLHNTRAIRLLILHPSEDASALLDLTLREVSLDDFPCDTNAYEALSYVWGIPTGNVSCTCDSQQLLITPNCDEALRQLRHAKEPRTLWVDAICIDQGGSEESVQERNVQITLMGQIYRHATRTLCWLGAGDKQTALIFKRLRDIGSCPSKRALGKLLVYDDQLRAYGDLKPGDTCLNKIFCHPWHSRVWTLQEVAFSWECQIVCGSETVLWDLYLAAAKFLVYDQYIHELDAQSWKNYVSLKIRDDLRSLLLGDDAERGHDESLELAASCLTQVRHLQATNPKDKIYGIYAVFSSLGIQLPVPDYDKSLATIYEEASVAMMLHSGSLQILSYASTNSRAEGLPSWVPDWQDENATLLVPPADATEASRIHQSEKSALSPRSGQLLVRGRVVGKIVTRSENDLASLDVSKTSLPILTGENYHLVNSEVDSLRFLVHQIRLFREWMNGDVEVNPDLLHLDDEEIGDFFQRIVTFDDVENQAYLLQLWVDVLQFDPSYDLEDGQVIADGWKTADAVNEEKWSEELFACAAVAAAMLTKSIKRNGIVVPEAGELLDFTAHITGNMGSRAMILVEDTQVNTTFPGTAFHEVRVGDLVVLLEGAGTPVVLRRKGNNWWFIGPAYLLGIMHGEGWLDEDEIAAGDLENFVLV